MSYGRAKGWHTKPKPGCFIDPTHPLSRGLVGCWLFNEGAGSRLTDYSGNCNHGVLTNMNPGSDWGGSPRGGGLKFNGVDDYVDIGKKFDSVDVSIHWRSMCNPETSGIEAIFNVDLIGTTKLWAYYWNLGTDGVYGIFDNGTVVYKRILDNSIIRTTWNDFSLVYSSSSGSLTLYLNGFPQSNTGAGTPSKPTISTRFGVGYNTFFGKINIDNIRIFNRVLSSEEVKWLYHEPYAIILSPVYRRYFIPVTVGGIAAKAMHQYRQRRVFV